MATAFAQQPLGKFFRIKHGFAFKGEHFVEAGDFVLLTPGNFEASGGLKLKGNKEKYYDGDIPPDFVLQRGDLIVAMTDLTQNAPILGAPAFIPEDERFLHNQRLGKVVDLDETKLDKRYLYYLFNLPSTREQLKATATGATVKHTAPERIYRVEAPVPQIALQRRIAEILSAYDDLIDNNTKRIKILEEMARSVYREWFVNFRFPGHEKVKMVNSPLGKVPEGWRVHELRDALTVHRGKSYKGTELADEGGLPFVNLKCFVRDGGFRRDGVKRFTGEAKPHQFVRAGDIVMAVTDMTQERRIVARAARIPRLTEPVGVISMDVVKLEPKIATEQEFVYAMLRYSSFPEEVKKHANGANVLHLNPDRIESYNTCYPPPRLVEKFGRLYRPLLEQADVLALKNDALAVTRDLLLPRLVSGEVVVEPNVSA